MHDHPNNDQLKSPKFKIWSLILAITLLSSGINIANGAALIATSVTPASLLAGANSIATVSFTTVSPIPAAGKIYITFGADFDVSTVTAVDCPSINGGFALGLPGGDVVTITRNGVGTDTVGGAAETCTITGVTNPPFAGSTGVYAIETRTAVDVVIDDDLAVTASIITPNVLAGTNVEPASLIASDVSTVTVSFTTTNDVLDDDKIKVTFGIGFDVSGAAGGTCGTMDGTFSTDVAGQVVTITRLGDGSTQAAAAETCTIDDITNPAAAGSTDTYIIQTTTSADAVRDEDDAVTDDVIVGPGALADTSVDLASLLTSAATTATINFTTVGDIPAAGGIIIIFGAGFDLSGVGAGSGTCATMDGDFATGALAAIPNALSITRDGTGTIQAGGGVESCEVSDVINPAAEGSTGTYTIRTLTAAGATIDEDAAVTASDIVDPAPAPAPPPSPPSGGSGGNTSPRPSGTLAVLINGGSKTTTDRNVKLTLQAGPNVGFMKIGSTADFKDIERETYVASKTWNLCGNKTECPYGSYNIYVKYYTKIWLQESGTITASILYQKPGTPTEPQPQPQPQPQPNPQPQPLPQPQPGPSPEPQPQPNPQPNPIPKKPAPVFSYGTPTKNPKPFEKDIFNNYKIDPIKPFIELLKQSKNFLAWEKKYRITVENGLQDSDHDGLCDELEYLYSTDPQEIDTDHDGFTDASEILDFKTNPNDASDPGSLENIEPRITGFENNQVIADSKPFIKGVAPTNSSIEIWIQNGSDEKKLLGTVAPNENGIFLFEVQEALPDGDYQFFVRRTILTELLKAHALGNNDSPIKITIKSNLDITPPNPKKLADQELSDETLLKNIRIAIKDNKPIIYGRTALNNKVEANWHSLVLSSAIIADTTAGEFTIAAPANLTAGNHEVYLQATRSQDNALSKTIKIAFAIQPDNQNQSPKSTPTTASSSESWWNNKVLWALAGVILLIGVGFLLKKRKPKP